MKKKPKKWLIEVTDQQLADIINCVEDCCRFACGQTEMQNTTAYIGDVDTQIALREELDKLHDLVAPELGHGGSYGWNGGSCPHDNQRKFIARNYGLYRELAHLRYIQEGNRDPMCAYNSPTLTCEEQGELPKMVLSKGGTYLDRMGVEYRELVVKINKLRAFVKTDKFEQLGEYRRNLLTGQLQTMELYATILDTRIKVECGFDFSKED